MIWTTAAQGLPLIVSAFRSSRVQQKACQPLAARTIAKDRMGMITLRLRLLSMAISVLLSGQAFAQTAADPTGEWAGEYSCNQGAAGLHLGIRTQADGTLTALFRFGSLPSNPSVPRGCFTLTGAFDPISRRVTLSPERWLAHPPGFAMVGLDGSLNPDGSRFAGTIAGGSACTTFDLDRLDPAEVGDSFCGSAPPVTAQR